MVRSVRAGVVAIAVAFLLTSILPFLPTASSEPAGGPLADDYSPSNQFAPGMVFGDYSSVIDVDPWARDFAVGDLNDDGLQDLAVISNYTNDICIYNRTNDGSLDSNPWRISKPGVIDMRSIVIGDLDKDLKNDIAVSYNNSLGEGKLCIFYYSDSFAHNLAKILSLSNVEPFQLVIGKFSGSDNCLAVVCRGDIAANYDDYIEVWKYPFLIIASDRRIHQITSSPAFSRSELLATGDINGDSRDDLVVGNYSGSNAYIMLQPTTWGGTWTTSTKTITGQASDIELADVLGNGRKDLVFANAANVGGFSYVYVYRNDGTGFDAVPQTPTKTYLGLGSVAIGEFSGAMGADLLTLCRTSANASAFLRNSVPTWYGSSANLTFPVDELPLKAIVDRSISGSEGVFILSQGPMNERSSITFYDAGSDLKGNADKNLFTGSKTLGEMATGKMANGNIVVVSVLPSSNEILVHELNTGKTRILHTESGPVSVCTGKFDLDSNDDIAVLNSITGSVSIYNGSTLFTSSYPIKNVTLPASGGHAITAMSIREDGFHDLAVAHDTGITILYCQENWQYFSGSSYENVGIGITGSRSALVTADFNDDAFSSDLAVLNSGTDTVEIYLRRSVGAVGDYYADMPSANLTDSGNVFLALSTGDFGDTGESGNLGLKDVAVLVEGSEVLIYLQPNFGFDAYTFSTPDATFDLTQEGKAISSGDVNDDGLDDIVVSCSSLPQLSPFLRTGSKTFVNRYNFTTGAQSVNVLAKDVDGDGRVDLLASSPGSHSLSIWFQANLAPYANATASKYTEFEGVDISYSGAASTDSYSDADSLNYTWTFDAGVLRYGQEVIYRYLTSGTKTVSLKVADRSGLASWSNVTIHSQDNSPSASFTYSPTSPVEGSPVQFTDVSTSYPDAIVNWTWSFGDGKFAYEATSPTHVFIGQGSYVVILQVRDSDGSMSAPFQRTVVVSDTAPIASFSPSSTTITEGESVTFTSTSTVVYDPIVNYTWDFDDGSFSYVPIVTHQFTASGSYSVMLTIRDSDGSISSTSTTIQVQDTAPTASFTFSPNNAPEGTSVSFFDASTGYDPIVNWTWDFDDGKLGYGQNVDHVFSDDGSFVVSLTVRDSDGSTSSTTRTVSVLDTSPSSSFTIEPGAPVEGVAVHFNSTSTSWDPLENWTWDIGSAKRYGASVSYVFPDSGNYLVRLTVRDDDGSTASSSQNLLVYEAELDADFTMEPGTIYEGVFVYFNDTSFSPVDPLVDWNWQFGDGSTGSGERVTHKYTRSGTFLVNLTVTDSDGSLGYKQHSLVVNEVVPVPSFTIEPVAILEGMTAFFNGTSTGYDPIVSWQWRFDDGHAFFSQCTTRAFGDGAHWANLTVVDSDGTMAWRNLTFIVLDTFPRGDFTYSAPVEGEETSFLDNSTTSWDEIISWSWDFGDGHNSDEQYPSHTYVQGGDFLVYLRVWDADGNSNLTAKWISVQRVLPLVHFTIDGERIEGIPLSLQSQAQSYDLISHMNWTFGDGTYRSGGLELLQVTKSYGAQGWYNITLFVQETDGDSNSSTVMIYVQDTVPSITSLRTTSGGDRYDEWQNVEFQVTVVPGHDALVSILWDFEGNGTFVPSSPPLANVSSHRYPASGVYLARAMVRDSDSQVLSQTLQFVIYNVQPSARYSWRNDTSVSGVVSFNASISTDTPNDLSTLQYRWDFGDGEGAPYSYNYQISHYFDEDGTYRVTLVVKDNDGIGSIPYWQNIVVDRSKPEVVMEASGENATVGAPISIVAKVTDDGSGVLSVTMSYRIGNGSEVSMPMTPSQSPNLYAALIPEQGNETDITYWIVARDNANNEWETQAFTIQVKAAVQAEDQTGLIILALVVVALLIALAFYIGRESVAVDEVFIIYQDGRLMAHQTRRLKPGMDDEILSSMLMAIQSFVKDSFKDESATHLQRLDFGEKKILVERGSSFFMAVVLHGKRAGGVPNRMQRVIQDIDAEYKSTLQDWDGDFEKVRGIKDRTERLMKGSSILPLGNSKKESGKKETEGPPKL